MARTITLFIVVIAVVLLLGQIPIENQTVGARFHKMVMDGLEWTQDMARSALFKDNSKKSKRWVRPAQTRAQLSEKKPKAVSLTPPPNQRDFEENITQADRESLMKILIDEK